MTTYVRCTRDGVTWYVSFFGQNNTAIESSLSDLGCSNIEYITESEWLAGQV